MARRFNITAGPSKFDLVMSHYHGDSSHRTRVKFALRRDEDSHEREATINKAERADGSGEEWILAGMIKTSSAEDKPYQAWFNTQTRRGRLLLV